MLSSTYGRFLPYVPQHLVLSLAGSATLDIFKVAPSARPCAVAWRFALPPRDATRGGGTRRHARLRAFPRLPRRGRLLLAPPLLILGAWMRRRSGVARLRARTKACASWGF